MLQLDYQEVRQALDYGLGCNIVRTALTPVVAVRIRVIALARRRT